MTHGHESFRSNRRALILTLSLATLGAMPGAGCNSLFGIHKEKPRPICVDPTGLLIDDMEDGDGQICELSGRQGSWWTDSDLTSTDLTPGKNVEFRPKRLAPGTRGASQYAAHFSGSGFTKWGAAMGLNLNQTEAGEGTVDASQKVGIKFSMKSNVPVSVKFDIPQTEHPERGGACVDSATAHNCYNHFYFEITATGPNWVDYEVPFAALRQLGGSATWNPSVLRGIQFFVGPNAPFDVWVDDLAFYYECSNPLCLPTCADLAFPQACPARGRYPASCVAAGTDCAVIVNWCADPLLIDDMEDGDQVICDSGGRQGWWWSGSDGSSTDLQPAVDTIFKPTMIPGGRGASHHAARLTGSGFTSGAMMGLDPSFNSIGGYDASAFNGITFWMKSNVPVRVVFPVPATIPISQSGTCDDTAVGTACNNHFQFLIGGTGDRWLEYKVPFAALTRDLGVDASFNPVASPGSVDLAHLKSIIFQPDAFAFDLWVDDVRFYTCSADSCLPTCPAGAPVACAASGGRPAGCWSAGTDCSLAPDLVILRSVWGSGRDDVWTVGVSNTTWSGTISHWDGATWTSAAAGATPMIYDVWGSGAADIWAVGDQGTILHNGGAGWSVSTSGTATVRPLNALWGSGTGEVWAVGGAGTVQRWNGALWTSVPSGTTQALWGMWGSVPDDVWAVGAGGTIVHWNGAAWSPSPSGTASLLRGVWGSAANDVWVVGYGGTVVHWNGSVWAPVAIPTTHDLFAVWGSAGNDVWAVGLWGTIIHWDGSTWTDFPSGTFQRLVSVWGSGLNDVWAVGYANTVLHWDGKLWSASRQ